MDTVKADHPHLMIEIHLCILLVEHCLPASVVSMDQFLYFIILVYMVCLYLPGLSVPAVDLH